MVGVVVLIVAIAALRDPKSGSTDTAAQSVTPSASTSVGAPPTSVSPSASASVPVSPSTSPSTSGAKKSSSTSTSASTSTTQAKSVPLVVLNNTTITGLAKQAAASFETGGWQVTSTGNLTNNIISTCAYYDPGSSGAKAAADALKAQFPTVRRVEPKFSGLPSGPVVVVLTPDYQSS